MTTLDWERVMRHESERAKPPDLPTCLDCGHVACRLCRDWCDVVLDDGELCCEGECRYSVDLEQLRRMMGEWA